MERSPFYISVVTELSFPYQETHPFTIRHACLKFILRGNLLLSVCVCVFQSERASATILINSQLHICHVIVHIIGIHTAATVNHSTTLAPPHRLCTPFNIISLSSNRKKKSGIEIIIYISILLKIIFYNF